MKMELSERITINPDICHGKPTIRNKRYTVDAILELLAAGTSHQLLLEEYPSLEEEDILACLAYASKLTKYARYTKLST
jgi:uncharacterized protein (DUF433 family)